MAWPLKHTLHEYLDHHSQAFLPGLGIAVAYYATAQFGISLAAFNQQASVIWPPSGIALACLLIFGRRLWPWVILGAFFAEWSVPNPALTAFTIAIGNTLSALVGATFLRHYTPKTPKREYFESLQSVMGFFFCSAIFSSMISAAIGAASLCTAGLQQWHEYSTIFLTWWLGDAGGVLIIAPLILCWTRGAYTKPTLERTLEAGALLTATVMICSMVFFETAAAENRWVYPYIAFLAVTWAAIRFGTRGVTMLTLLISTSALWTTIEHIGPFTGMPTHHALGMVQIYTMVVAMIGLTISAAISDCRHSEQRAQENWEHLQNVIDHIPDPVFMKNRQHILMGGNQALWAALNGPPGKFLGKDCKDVFVNSDEIQAFNEKYDKVFRTGKTQSSEEVFTDSNGNRHILSIRLALLKSAKREPVLVAVARDITELKSTESLLRKYTHELEERNRELDDFAHIASHDLKEPLRGMGMLATMLVEDYQDKVDPDILRRLHRITFLSRRMAELVGDLLHYSRLGRADSMRQLVDPNLLLTDLKKIIEPLCSEKNATIDTPQAMPVISCCKIGLEEVLRNLIINAITYNDKAEKHVEVGLLETAPSPNGIAKNVFYVKDNGIGIAPQYHRDIFRIFRRMPTSAMYDEAGTGVGLTFVKKIIDRSNGRIWLQSELGKSTTFYFTMG